MAHWTVLISVAEPYVEKPYPTVPPAPNPPDDDDTSSDVRRHPHSSHDLVLLPPSPPSSSPAPAPAPAPPSAPTHPPITTKRGPRGSASGDAGAVIGILLTVILLLLFAILYVVARGRREDGSAESKSPRPTHSLLTEKLTSRFNLDYRPYEVSSSTVATSKVSLQRQPSLSADPNSVGSCQHTQETIYEEPASSSAAAAMKLYSSSGFLSLNRKFSSDPVLSEEGDGADDDDYAEPVVVTAATAANLTTSNSFSENFGSSPLVAASSSSPVRRALAAARTTIKPLPLSHYARPMTPSSPTSAAATTTASASASALVGSPLLRGRRMSQQSAISAKVSPPRYTTVAPTLPPPPPPPQRPLRASLLDANANTQHAALVSPLLPSAGATTTLEGRDPFLSVRRVLGTASSPASSRSNSLASSSIFPLPSSSRADTTTEDDDDDGARTQDDVEEEEEGEGDDGSNFPFYYASADVCVPDAQDLASLYRKIDETWQQQQAELQQQHREQQQQQQRQKQRQQQQQCQSFVKSGSLERIVGFARLKEVPRSKLKTTEKLGEGQFGEIHLCQFVEDEESVRDEGAAKSGVDNRRGSGVTVAVKSLREGCNQAAR